MPVRLSLPRIRRQSRNELGEITTSGNKGIKELSSRELPFLTVGLPTLWFAI